MRRIDFLLLGLVALLALGFQSPALSDDDDDDDDWKGQQNRIEQQRKESEKRYEQWHREQGKRYQTWRDAAGNEQDRVLELSDSGLEPGRYTIRLPFGMGVRVNVQDNPRVPKGPPAWGERNYGDVHNRARQIGTQLRELHLDLQRVGNGELAAETARVYEQEVQLTNAVATRRPATEIRAAFTEFDRLWHPLAHRVNKNQNLGASAQRRVAAVNELEEGLHQIMAISPAPPYDRPLVAALVDELAQTTSHLLEDLRVEPEKTHGWQAITLRAKRVKEHAADLNATVRENAAFTTIVEEYEEFDRTWHRLLEYARVTPELDAQLRRTARKVRQIDLQLHQALYVNVPVVSDRQQRLHMSAGIAKTADHLADDLAAEIGKGKRDLLQDARVLASVAVDLNRQLSERQSAQDELRTFKELLVSWQRLKAQIVALQGDRFEHSQSIAAQLGAEIDRLQLQWPGA